MEAKEFITICKEVFPAVLSRMQRKRSTRAYVSIHREWATMLPTCGTTGVSPGVGARISAVSTIGHPKNLRINCNK